MKPEKLTSEELETELPLCGGAYAVRRLRAHIAALEAERDEWRQRWQDEDNAARHAREANQAERQRALDAEAALVAIRQRAEAEKRMVTVQPLHIAGLVTRVIDRILGAGEVSAPSAVDPLHPNGRCTCTCAGEGTCAWCEAAARQGQDAMSAPATADAFAKVLTTLEACRIFINGPLGTQAAELRDAEIPAAIADLVSLERRMGALARAIQDAPHGETRRSGRNALVMTCDCWKSRALTDAPPVFTLEASKASDAAYGAVFRIYGDATRARQVADEVLAALRGIGGGQ